MRLSTVTAKCCPAVVNICRTTAEAFRRRFFSLTVNTFRSITLTRPFLLGGGVYILSTTRSGELHESRRYPGLPKHAMFFHSAVAVADGRWCSRSGFGAGGTERKKQRARSGSTMWSATREMWSLSVLMLILQIWWIWRGHRGGNWGGHQRSGGRRYEDRTSYRLDSYLKQQFYIFRKYALLWRVRWEDRCQPTLHLYCILIKR